jgi:hypothetical protein
MPPPQGPLLHDQLEQLEQLPVAGRLPDKPLLFRFTDANDFGVMRE